MMKILSCSFESRFISWQCEHPTILIRKTNKVMVVQIVEKIFKYSNFNAKFQVLIQHHFHCRTRSRTLIPWPRSCTTGRWSSSVFAGSGTPKSGKLTTLCSTFNSVEDLKNFSHRDCFHRYLSLKVVDFSAVLFCVVFEMFFALNQKWWKYCPAVLSWDLSWLCEQPTILIWKLTYQSKAYVQIFIRTQIKLNQIFFSSWIFLICQSQAFFSFGFITVVVC